MYVQPLEHKDIYHDVMWYATVTWRARKAMGQLIESKKQATGRRKKREKKKKKKREKIQERHTTVRHPLHLTSVTPTLNSDSAYGRLGMGSCWGDLGIEIMTATWRVVSAGGCLKNKRCSGFSQEIGRATWP